MARQNEPAGPALSAPARWVLSRPGLTSLYAAAAASARLRDMFRPLPAAALLVLLLAACGGGGSDTPAAPPPAATVPPPPSGALATCGLADFRNAAMARINQWRASGADCGSEGRFAATTALAWNDVLA